MRSQGFFNQGGFTLVEVLVTLAIMVIVSGVILSQSARNRGELDLLNQAYDLALFFREAQVYGGSTAEKSVGAGNFDHAYGVHVSNATPQTATLFVDSNANGRFDSGEGVKQFVLARNAVVSRIGAFNGTSYACTAGTDKSEVAVSFLRPRPDAIVKVGATGYQHAALCLTSPSADGVRKLTVFSTGQISVE